MLPLRDARPPRRTPVVTALLLVACTLVFGLELAVMTLGGEDALVELLERWGLIPAGLVAALQAGDVASQPVLTVFTHMFLHGGWLHLMGNMLFLWIFAVNVEDRLGRVPFLLFYLVGGVAAAAGHMLVDPASEVPMVGASGAISAVLGGYLVLFPRARIQSLVFLVFFYELIAVPAVLVLGFWFVLQVIDGFASLGLTGDASSGIAFWAHIGGFVAGMAMALPLRVLRREPRPVVPDPPPLAAPPPPPRPAPPPPPPAR
ncbi:MAG TPA: rhomboid family intramembrane serine protease [Candidatus Limnocylindrales bacterium]|nr:rhomboid family intramembrane serine protease [Candidatus Limnocylindrales bacterium]